MKEMVIYSHKLHGSQPWVHIRITWEFKKFQCPGLHPMPIYLSCFKPSLYYLPDSSSQHLRMDLSAEKLPDHMCLRSCFSYYNSLVWKSESSDTLICSSWGLSSFCPPFLWSLGHWASSLVILALVLFSQRFHNWRRNPAVVIVTSASVLPYRGTRTMGILPTWDLESCQNTAFVPRTSPR